MTTETATAPTTAPALGVRNKIGLALCVVLCLADVASLGSLGGPTEDGTNGPPAGILVTCAVLGVIGLAVAFVIWRRRSRPAARVLAGTRILSALTAVPAFFVDGVPAALVIVASTGIVVTVVAVWLLLARPGR